jgi:NAD(P)-dependent dehydrogenase (short-subunit alcohol dehydrogenase family)
MSPAPVTPDSLPAADQRAASSRPVVLVTGAAKRLGRAMALDLARHGFDVAVHYRHSATQAQATVAELKSIGASAHAFAADLSIEAECRSLVPAVVAHFKRLDAVVNSASTFENDDAATFSMAAMEKHWRANTAPAVLLAQALHDHLAVRASAARRAHEAIRASTGCVVNIIDQKLWNPNPDYFSYTMSKAALQCATIMLAQALAPSVRVCGVAPGLTMPSDVLVDEQFDAAHRMTPLQRSSTPEDIAHAVRFLIESPAVTGTTLLVDGGQHLSAQPRDVFYLANKK